MNPTKTEPVSLVQVIHLILAALVAIGWASIDDATIDIIGSAIAGIISIGAQLWARHQVTPMDKPGAPKVDDPTATTDTGGRHSLG